ncbi:MAG: bifunctional 5,10-methylenetetrahydrofolate dehydrogenase/5,10-methenyltetrahydrofolate cyclohydrolase [Bacillota bacterium]|jgi:methylenetetrahydrofolate dehydrogenase (NADP+)/methenyltetrahydrofolate cyclohydrolase
MTRILYGKEVAELVKENNLQKANQLRAQNIIPRLGIIRVGERPDDLYYQKSLEKVCAAANVDCRLTPLAEKVEQTALEKAISTLSADSDVHGILLFNPLPRHLDSKKAKELISPLKDVDCLTKASAANVFTDEPESFAPCTAAAVMELLQHYQLPLAGKRVTIVGRSLVVGKPLAMLMMKENATVTICHSRTKDLPGVCREADILVAAIGKAQLIDHNYVKKGQIVIDVGINPHPHKTGHICGDLDYDNILPIVEAITPVPGGVGSVTSSILLRQTIQACQKIQQLVKKQC